MNCRDFERIWNEQLDAREAVSPAIEQALEAHTAACPACQAASRRYQVLRQAIRAWGPAPAAPEGFADRFLARHEPAGWRPATWFVRLRTAAWGAAIAAALLLAVSAGGRPRWLRPARPARKPAPAAPIDPQVLGDALADATSATWDLARATSAPAARIGRGVLGKARLPDASPLPLPVEVDPASDALKRVGDRVNAGVRPFSGTARNAFGFLLGPSADAGAPPRPAKGA